jgi:hypothetical protein
MSSLLFVLAAYVQSAQAVCVLTDVDNALDPDLTTSAIEEHAGLHGGVPNYHQDDHLGNCDCGPVAAAMILGFHDANGWSCLIDGPPYLDQRHGDTSDVDDLVSELGSALPYTDDDGCALDGTWGWENLVPILSGTWGADLLSVVRARDPDTQSWTAEDYENPTEDLIRDEIDAGRPMMLAVTRYGVEAEWFWQGGSRSLGVSGHIMPVIGYRHRELGRSFLGFGCHDWLAFDDFFMRTRSGIRRGGDSYLEYNWYGIDLTDLYAVAIRPDGTSTCRDEIDADGDGYATVATMPGIDSGSDCDDSRATTYPGAFEFCNGRDDNCNGQIDDGDGDVDGDGVSDHCDPDADNDGIESSDNCPLVPNPDQHDDDGDGNGDACDPCPHDDLDDIDGDGVCGDIDVCPSDWDPEQHDGPDGDGIGDICDPDDDNDSVPDTRDNCPVNANNEQVDTDDDGLGDPCDNCDDVPNPDQTNHDGDSRGDDCDDDDDNDGFPDWRDPCPHEYMTCFDVEAKLEAARMFLEKKLVYLPEERQPIRYTLGGDPCFDCPLKSVAFDEDSEDYKAAASYFEPLVMGGEELEWDKLGTTTVTAKAVDAFLIETLEIPPKDLDAYFSDR